MKHMSLRRIADACGGKLVVPAGPCTLAGMNPDTPWEKVVISSAVLDSRLVTPGALFFATVGERVDGHSFIGEVFAKGACCVVTQKDPAEAERENGVDAGGWGAYIQVEDSVKALQDVAAYYRSTLQIPVVGITGSVGKTSTKEYIAGVLSRKYRVLKTDRNFNNEIGLSLTILKIREEHEAAVVEMGISDFGEMHRLGKIARPTICVITNIGQCHLENLKDRDGIFRAKTEIFEEMDPEGEVVLNGDDDKLAAVELVHDKKPHFFGLGENDREEIFAADIVSHGLSGSEAVLYRSEGDKAVPWLPVTVTQPGQHMVTNAAAAALVGSLLGLSGEEIARGILAVTPVDGRSHLIKVGDYTLIDDCYNANPVSVKAAIDLLGYADGPKTAILGDMFELGVNSEALHHEVGEYAAGAHLDRLLCIGTKAEEIYKGALQAGMSPGKVFYFPEKAQCLEAVRKDVGALIPARSAILIKASHGMNFTELVTRLPEFLLPYPGK